MGRTVSFSFNRRSEEFNALVPLAVRGLTMDQSNSPPAPVGGIKAINSGERYALPPKPNPAAEEVSFGASGKDDYEYE